MTKSYAKKRLNAWLGTLVDHIVIAKTYDNSESILAANIEYCVKQIRYYAEKLYEDDIRKKREELNIGENK